MGYKTKLLRNFSRVEPRKIGLAVLATCLLVSMTLLSMAMPRSIPLPISSLRLPLHPPPASFVANDTANFQHLVEDAEQKNAMKEIKARCRGKDSKSDLCGDDDVIRLHHNLSSKASDASLGKEGNGVTWKLGNQNEVLERNTTFDDHKPSQDELHGDIRFKDNSTTIADLTQREDMIQQNFYIARINSTQKEGEETNHETTKPKIKPPLCNFSDPRYDICEMDGDIRIHGNSSNVIFVTSPQVAVNPRNESWRIRPYARKGDEYALKDVRQVVVSSSDGGPSCTLNHSVPAIVFSVTGFTGNLFHDFTDVLLPLFLTARQYDGEVQFLVTDTKPWWISKYRLFLKALSGYEIIYFDKDDRIHCFKHVIIGLHCHKELSIDPTRPPKGYTMVDFMRFMRSAYSLERDRAIRIGEVPGKKPRLLVIARKRTRTFLNVDEIVQMAEQLGYEVVVDEANLVSDVAKFARVVNSCDVMMGVHGAGLTNFVYLPANASLIQIVPWGGLEGICKLDFGDAAMDAKLKYLQHSIMKDESSLVEMYPMDHPVFKDPFSYHGRGWDLLRATFMDKQNVRLDVRRFRAVLLEALEHLKQ